MRNAALALIVIAAFVGTAEAQGRGRGNGKSKNIPPGHLPRDGECRVWYDGVPPGRQPAPMNCDQAERVASRDGNARVIYGDDRRATRNRDERYRDRDGRDRDDRQRDRTTGSSRYPEVYGSSPNRGNGYNTVPFQNGERDGYEKGREDARDRDSYDPVRHSWYRSGDRGYNNRYGTRDDYKLAYRDGFESGYERGYREVRGYGSDRGNTRGFRLPGF